MRSVTHSQGQINQIICKCAVILKESITYISTSACKQIIVCFTPTHFICVQTEALIWLWHIMSHAYISWKGVKYEQFQWHLQVHIVCKHMLNLCQDYEVIPGKPEKKSPLYLKGSTKPLQCYLRRACKTMKSFQTTITDPAERPFCSMLQYAQF